jgi:hypothetical protein
MTTYVHLWYLAEFFLDDKCFRQKLHRKSKHTFYVDNVTQNRDVNEIVEKYCKARQATDDYNTAQALCMLDN